VTGYTHHVCVLCGGLLAGLADYKKFGAEVCAFIFFLKKLLGFRYINPCWLSTMTLKHFKILLPITVVDRAPFGRRHNNPIPATVA
jgi:hypothetical protein